MPTSDLQYSHNVLLNAAKYALVNLEFAAQNKLIKAPRNFQIQLSEMRKMLANAIAIAEEK